MGEVLTVDEGREIMDMFLHQADNPDEGELLGMSITNSCTCECTQNAVRIRLIKLFNGFTAEQFVNEINSLKDRTEEERDVFVQELRKMLKNNDIQALRSYIKKLLKE